jgi:phosphate/sulfate permease
VNDGDPTFGRLIGDAKKGYSLDNPSYPFISPMPWWYIIPPIVLMFITRFGLPVSTTFLILTFFKTKGLTDMIIKSVLGYAVAFALGALIYLVISRPVEQRYAQIPPTPQEARRWTILQWLSTGFLWVQWLIQDFANLFVYLPRKLDLTSLLVSMLGMVALIGYIFYTKGGKIQKIVTSKTNTADIRSATIIDFLYGAILMIFAEWSKIPMSTTWVFIGLLAGRELGIRYQISHVPGIYRKNGMSRIRALKKVQKLVVKDLGKASLGMVISVILVILITLLNTGKMPEF